MTEQALKQIHINNRLLAGLQAEYEEICGHIGISPLVQDGMPRGGSYKATGIPNVEKRVDIEMEYRKLYEDNRRLIERAREYIRQFPDELIRIILTHKYVNGLDVYQVAMDIGVDASTCKAILRTHWNNVF